MKKNNTLIIVGAIILVIAIVFGGSYLIKKETERVSKNQSLNAAKGVLDGARLYYAEQLLKEQPVYDGVEVIDLELTGKYPENAADLIVSFEDGVINIGVMKFEHGCYEVVSGEVKEADCSLVGTQNNASNNDEPSKDENEGPVVEEVSVRDSVVVETMDKILCDFSESEICSVSDLGLLKDAYYKNLSSYNELSDDVISYLVYQYALEHDMLDKSNLDEINSIAGQGQMVGSVLSVEQFQNILNILFGNKVKYRHFNVDDPNCFYLSYDTESNTYRQYNACGGICFPKIYTKLLSASKYDDQLRVDVMAYHGSDCGGGMYYTFNSEEPFYDGPDDYSGNGVEPAIIFNQYSSQIQKYRFVFTEDKGQYYFDHVEKVEK